MLKSKENYKRKLSKLKRQMQTQPNEKENQLVDQLKYNPKFDILNREHLLNKPEPQAKVILLSTLGPGNKITDLLPKEYKMKSLRQQL